MNQQKTGGFLKELRKEKGITQEQLAEVFGVSSRTVSRWENGVNMPSFFGYLLWSLIFLVPVFLLDSLLFFL